MISTCTLLQLVVNWRGIVANRLVYFKHQEVLRDGIPSCIPYKCTWGFKNFLQEPGNWF